MDRFDCAIGDAIHVEASAIGHGLELLRDAGIKPVCGQAIAIASTDPVAASCVAIALIAEGCAVVMLPGMAQESVPNAPGIAEVSVSLRIENGRISVATRRRGGDTQSDPLWSVALFTSGSTGPPRAIAITSDALRLTSTWYRDCYGTDEDTVVATTLPLSYNFAFIAGLYHCANTGATMRWLNPNEIVSDLYARSRLHSRCVCLANPLTLEHIAEGARCLGENVLIDSGGAPLSIYAVRWLRSNISDVREGYGLTETCSLTHFDDEGTPESLGTVGRARVGVKVSIESEAPRAGRIIISTPNQCLRESLARTALGAVDTGDIGLVDQRGRLRLLGRSDDHAIRGMWPRDILDHIGPTLGPRCALITTRANSVSVRTWSSLGVEEATRVRNMVAEFLSIPPDAVSVETKRQVLHSIKLPRPDL